MSGFSPGLRSTSPAAVAIGAAALVAFTVLALRFGAVALLGPPALVGAWLLLQRPRLAVGITVGAFVAFEHATDGPLGALSKLVYKPLGQGLQAADLLVALAVLAVVLDLVRRHEAPHLPRVLLGALTLLGLAVAAGVVTGMAAGYSFKDTYFAGRSLPYLVILPWLVANVLETREQVKRVLRYAALLVGAKALIGLFGVASGRGTRAVEGSVITYYEATVNWLTLGYVIGVIAAALARIRLPWWVWLGAVLSFASLLLSFRRGFWIAAALAIVLVVVLGMSALTRRLALPLVLVLGLSLYFLLGSTSIESSSPIAKRLASLNPSKVAVNAEDRYRLDERANVLATLAARPVTGIGLGPGWPAYARPLPVEHPGGRLYVHMAALWFWLKLGILGLATYLALLLTGAGLFWRAWRGGDRTLRAIGLTGVVGVFGLALVETTGTFTGADVRFSSLVGATLGFAAVVARLSATR